MRSANQPIIIIIIIGQDDRPSYLGMPSFVFFFYILNLIYLELNFRVDEQNILEKKV